MASLKLVFGLIALAVVASAAPAEEFGIDEYIVGGQTARPNQFPFVVSLRNRNNFHFCGGGIISNQWILSAAHCTQEGNSQAQNVFVFVGAHHIANDGQPLAVAQIINHPGYSRPTVANDVSVLRTTQQIQFVQGRVQALRLPTQDYTDIANQRAWIAGWGVVQAPNRTPTHLQFKETFTITRQDCRNRLAPLGLGQLIADNKLCTLTRDGVGTCRGDSGGPLVTDQGVVVGVVSWGIPPCGTQHPDVYARVFPQLRFIVQATGVRPQ